MKEWIKSKLNPPVDESKRKFIRNAAGLAALTAAASVSPAILLEKEREIDRMIRSGLVSGQTFYIDDPVVISIDNVRIENCKFVATRPMDHILEVESVNKLIIRNCVFITDDYGFDVET